MSMSGDDSLEQFLAGESMSSSVSNSYPYPSGKKTGSSFQVGQRVEALLGTSKDKQMVGGVVLAETGYDSYTVLFDSGYEFENVHVSLLSEEENKVKELETQLAHLRWRKMQNEAKIKETLESSRKMKANDIIRQLEQNRSHEKAEWVQTIIEDELSRPLEVTEEFMQKFEREEDKLRNSLEESKYRHLKSVDFLEKTVNRREANAIEIANKLSYDAAEASRKANEIHNQIIKTRHMLAVDYESVPEEELDNEDMITMDLLRKRISLLSEQHVKAREEAEILAKKSSDASINARLSFQPDLPPDTLLNLNTNSAKVHHGLVSLREKLKQFGMEKEMTLRERQALAKKYSNQEGGAGGMSSGGYYMFSDGSMDEASRISPAASESMVHTDFPFDDSTAS